MPSPHLHRRKTDPPSVPVVTIHHGSNKDCPDVQEGRWSRCLGHVAVPEEGPAEHLRNALGVIRVALDFGQPVFGCADGPGVIVPIRHLARLQARIEAALSLLEIDGHAYCMRCRGTILPPTRGGVPRGSCHCPPGERERVTDWSTSPPKITDPE